MQCHQNPFEEEEEKNTRRIKDNQKIKKILNVFIENTTTRTKNGNPTPKKPNDKTIENHLN